MCATAEGLGQVDEPVPVVQPFQTPASDNDTVQRALDRRRFPESPIREGGFGDDDEAGHSRVVTSGWPPSNRQTSARVRSVTDSPARKKWVPHRGKSRRRARNQATKFGHSVAGKIDASIGVFLKFGDRQERRGCISCRTSSSRRGFVGHLPRRNVDGETGSRAILAVHPCRGLLLVVRGGNDKRLLGFFGPLTWLAALSRWPRRYSRCGWHTLGAGTWWRQPRVRSWVSRCSSSILSGQTPLFR